MIVDNQYYQFYPDFNVEDIGKDTSNMFIDTLVMSNLYLKGLGGDGKNIYFDKKYLLLSIMVIAKNCRSSQ